ncbi:MAG TPA: TIM44-like domain-containing protein [Chitinophagaceae bacterium]|nr:TIM44-like domain-containing protein [Chitinophagaceae bacterium]
MRISWNSLKISIAGARLSHLVQKDRIWDHGSMTEQVRVIFFKLKKAKARGSVQELKKYVTKRFYERLKKEMDDFSSEGKRWVIKNEMIKEIAVIEVGKGSDKKPDCFTALINAVGIQYVTDVYKNENAPSYSDCVQKFSERWSFVRQGEWWLLDGIRAKT